MNIMLAPSFYWAALVTKNIFRCSPFGLKYETNRKVKFLFNSRYTGCFTTLGHNYRR